MTLHETIILVDIPVLYTLLLASAPLVTVALRYRSGWILVLAGSWALWAFDQGAPQTGHALPWPVMGNGLAYFSAWQALFFTAMVVGYHRDRIAQLISAHRRRLLVLTSIGVMGLFALYVEAYWRAGALADLEWFGPALPLKGDLPPARIVGSILVFSLLYLVATELWIVLHRCLGWLFIPLGQNALLAYSCHVVVAITLWSVVGFDPHSGAPRAINSAVQAATVTLVWLMSTRRWGALWLPIAVVLLLLAPAIPRIDWVPLLAEGGGVGVVGIAVAWSTSGIGRLGRARTQPPSTRPSRCRPIVTEEAGMFLAFESRSQRNLKQQPRGSDCTTSKLARRSLAAFRL